MFGIGKASGKAGGPTRRGQAGGDSAPGKSSGDASGRTTNAPCKLVPPKLSEQDDKYRKCHRGCCLLFGIKYERNLGITNVWLTLNIVDPNNIGRHRVLPGEKLGIVYTTRGGFLDFGHIRELCDITKSVYDQIMAARPDFPATIKTLNGQATFKECPPVSSEDDVINLARMISFDDGVGHEIVTFGRFGFGEDQSSFSPEDLYSNYLGTLVAARALKASRATKNFDAAVDAELRRLLSALGAVGANETLKIYHKAKASLVNEDKQFGPLNKTNYLKVRHFKIEPYYSQPTGNPPPPAEYRPPQSDVVAMYRRKAPYEYTHTEKGANFKRSAYASKIQGIIGGTVPEENKKKPIFQVPSWLGGR